MKSSLALRSSRVVPTLLGPVAAMLLIGSVPVLVGCNGITGAGDLVFNDGAGGSGGDGTTTGAGTTTGGNTTGAGTGTSTGAGATTGSTGAATGGSTGSGSNCMYPTGSYGAMQGSLINPSLHWQGYREGGGTTVSDIAITEYFDCDGSKNVNALYVATSATWCGNCQAEASDFPGLITSKWASMGIKVITLMIEDINGGPASTQTALEWRDNFGLTSVSVVADPNFSMAGGGGTVGLPLLLVVDPRTMTVVDRQEGYSGSHVALESLAQQNATP